MKILFLLNSTQLIFSNYIISICHIFFYKIYNVLLSLLKEINYSKYYTYVGINLIRSISINIETGLCK